MNDYYKILEVEQTATSDEIKKAYRHLAKKWHPDACNLPNSQEKFVEITEAYEILIDSRKRKEYDELWHFYKHQHQENRQTNYTYNDSSTYNDSNTHSNSNTYNDSNTYSNSSTYNDSSTYSNSSTYNNSNTHSNSSTYNDSNTYSNYHYANKAYEDYYKQKERSFTANQADARNRAQAYYNMSLEDLLSKVIGIVIDSTVKVAKYTVLGEEDVKLTFGDRLLIGLQGFLFILMVILTLTGIFAPIGAPLGMILYKSMMKKGKFIGFGKLITSTLMFVGLLLLGVVIITYLISESDNSRSYASSNTYDEPSYNRNETSNTTNSYSEYDYNDSDNAVNEIDYVKPTQLSNEKLNLIVDAFIEVGRSAYGYQYSHTEIGEVVNLNDHLYQTYHVVQIDTLENRDNKIWTLYEPLYSEVFYVESDNDLYDVNTLIYYRSFVPAESATWAGKQIWDGQEVLCFNALTAQGIQCYGVDIYTKEVILPENSYIEQDESLPEPDKIITSNEEVYSDEINTCIEYIKMYSSYSSMEVVPLYDYILDETIASKFDVFYGEDIDMSQLFIVDKDTYSVYLYDDDYNIDFGENPISVANIVSGLGIYVDDENIKWVDELSVVPVRLINTSNQTIDLYGLGVRGESTSSATDGLYADIYIDLKDTEELLPGETHTIKLNITPVDPFRNTSLCFFHMNDPSHYEYYTSAWTRTAY